MIHPKEDNNFPVTSQKEIEIYELMNKELKNNHLKKTEWAKTTKSGKQYIIKIS